MPRCAQRSKELRGPRDLAGWASQPGLQPRSRLRPPSHLQRRLGETAVPAITAQGIVPWDSPSLKPPPQPHGTRLQQRPLPPLQSELRVAPNSAQPPTKFGNRKDSSAERRERGPWARGVGGKGSDWQGPRGLPGALSGFCLGVCMLDTGSVPFVTIHLAVHWIPINLYWIYTKNKTENAWFSPSLQPEKPKSSQPVAIPSGHPLPPPAAVWPWENPCPSLASVSLCRAAGPGCAVDTPDAS